MYKNINSNIFHWYTCIHYDSILINVGFKISRHCKSSLFYITTHTKSPTIVIKRQSSFLSWISWITQLHIHLFTNKYTITIDIMFCNNKSGQVEYHDYCWEQTDKIGVIHSKEIVNMSNTGNIQLASELSVAVQTIKRSPRQFFDSLHFNNILSLFPSSICICWMAIWLSFTRRSPWGIPSLMRTALMFSIFERQISSLIVA